jgi:D-serine deaminase-like pyridoxal phosphate-dependent protein
MTTAPIKLDPRTYRVAEAGDIFSPGLVVFKDLLLGNLREMLRIAGGPRHLRPHCKTHKMPAVIRIMQELDIRKHKCATIAEAEMLCGAGARDIVIAYQMVGPNIERFAQLVERFPEVRFATLVDHPDVLEALGSALHKKARTAGVLLDVDPGMGRTGIQPDESARQLYEMICSTPGVEPAGLHWYDGHHRQSDLDERKTAVETAWVPLTLLRDQLLLQGFPVPRVVVAGTGSFPVLAEFGEPDVELTPGTTTLYDVGYLQQFPDLDLQPAAGVLTRVVSCNRRGYLTLDCGHKSISPDQPAGQRTLLPELPDAVEIAHTEEHLVIRTDRAQRYSPGDHLIALPRHVCPTTALHQFANVIEGGRLVDCWPVTARDRVTNPAKSESWPA